MRSTSKRLADEVLHCRGQAQALDALRSPLGGDLIARRAPDFFGVALEEGEVELASEAVDEEVFEALLFFDRAHARRRVADADPDHPHRAEILDGVAAELDGVVEELAQIVDAALARAYEHYVIAVLRIRSDDGRRMPLFLFDLVIDGVRLFRLRRDGQRSQAAQRRLLRQVSRDLDFVPLALVGDLDRLGNIGVRCGRHQLQPPLHHAVALGEEAVAADVHAVALVADGAGDAADLVGGLEYDGLNRCFAKQFQGRSESCRTCSDDDCFLRHRSPFSLRVYAIKDYRRLHPVEFGSRPRSLSGNKGRFAILKDGSPLQETTLH